VDAIALAGGFTELASRNAVKVIRESKSGRRKTFIVPVGDILNSGDKSRDLLLEEGDTISVSESAF
jgi:protein involved in polysaccharide export with SLBB domain